MKLQDDKELVYEVRHGRAGYWRRTPGAPTAPDPPVPPANLEPDSSDEPLGTEQALSVVTPCRIHIHSIRKRLADSDGISAKALIDGIVHAGLLPDDRTEEIEEVRFSQQKGPEELTIISIY